MVNEPMRQQTTVRELMAALEHHQPQAVVIIELPPGSDGLRILRNVEIPQQDAASPVFRLRLQH